MSICTDDCGFNPFKAAGFNCNPSRKSGGIKHLVFAHCSVKIDDLNDLSVWCDYISKGKITITNELLANKPQGEYLTKKLDYCTPDSYVGALRSIEFTDYTADPENNDDYKFWSFLSKEYYNYQVGFITCDDYFSGFIPNFELSVSNLIEESSTGLSYWQGKLRWASYYELEPLFLPNLITVLRGDCSQVPGVNKCPEDILIINRTGKYTACNPDDEFVFEALPLVKGAIYTWEDDNPTVILTGVEENILTVKGVGLYTLTINRAGCSPLVLTVEILPDNNVPTIFSIIKLTLFPSGNYGVSVGATDPCVPLGGRQVRVYNVGLGIYTPWIDGILVNNLSAGTYYVEIRCKDNKKCFNRSNTFTLP